MIFVVGQNNKTYAGLSFNVGPGGQILIPAVVDYSRDFGPSNHELWDAEYEANVRAVEWLSETSRTDKALPPGGCYGDLALPCDFLEEFEKMESAERRFILDEMAGRPELWDEESEVFT